MSQQDWGRRSRRVLATIGVATLALFGAIAGGSAAHADGPEVGNIVPGTKGSITVHKFEEHTPPGDFNPDGSSSTAGFTELNGVEFSLYRINGVDLTTQAGWDIVDNLTVSATGVVSDGTTTYTTTQVGATQETTAGVVTFSNLDIAAYVVMEGDDNGGNNITTKAAPFLVTVPLPHDDSWLYHVHTYPKNSVTTVDKTVTSPGTYGLGSTVDWPITVKIPTLAPGDNFSSFVITDTLDSRLEYVSYTMTAGSDPVPVRPADPAGAVVTTPTLGTPGGTFTATLVATDGSIVDPDLNAFLQARAGQDLVLTLKTKVVGVGTIVNDLANVNINGNTIETPEPATRWGDLVIRKTDQGNPAKVLAGATFQVYSGACVITDGKAAGVGSPISVNGETTFTTGATDGIATIVGLWVGDTVTTPVAPNTDTSRQYCVIETGAPAGYDIKAPGGWDVMVNAGATEGVDLIVDNPQKPPVALPLTGSTGTAMFVAGGLALILVAGGASIIAIRRRQHMAEK